MIDRQTSAITPGSMDNYWVNRLRCFLNGRALAVGEYRAPFIASTYDAHPRQRWIARDFGPTLGKGGSGWLVPQAASDHTVRNYDESRMMACFNCHVRDALAFNY